MRAVLSRLLLAASLASVSIPSPAVAAGIDSPEYWKAGCERLARMGRGFVVWETNRSGDWRIWRIELDGTNPRPISPDEKNRDHYCPHLSPDGRRIAYLSYPKNHNTYEDFEIRYEDPVPLHLMSADGRYDRILAPNARAYGEDRGAVWLNNSELVTIGGDYRTYRLNVETGESSLLLDAPPKGSLPSLIDPTLRYATSGSPNFSPYDPKTRSVRWGAGEGGCQPYFSRDGAWGFWMAGSGGPINRYRLETGQISPILERVDPRMPKERHYLYFPMLSANQRLFAFAASPEEHDHFTADYDIFVAPIDPGTLELTGDPVRYTFDKGNDRFPDVYLADLELGDYRGEAPFTVDFRSARAKGNWRWDFGGGKREAGDPSPSHVFDRPGEYGVTARQDGRLLRGRVTVEAARPPRADSIVLEAPASIRVTFDEPIRLQKPAFRLSSRTPVKAWRLGEDGRSLRLTAEKPLSDGEILALEGVFDRAQVPNRMTLTHYKVEKAVWPSSRDGIVFLWETGNRPNRVGAGASQRACRVSPRGAARLNHDYAMELAGGAYTADDAGDAVASACKKTNRLSVEATFIPERLDQTGPARIVSLSTDPYTRDFTLGQDGNRLVFRLRTPLTGENGVNPEMTLCALPDNRPVHLIVTYEPGALICYRDGKEVLRSDRVQGDFSNWTPQHLVFGDEWSGEREWAGSLEGIAIYDRVLSPKEAIEHFRRYRAVRQGRRTVPRAVADATLTGASKVPTLREIRPYRDALALYEYRIEKVTAGRLAAKTVRAARWVILNGERLPAADAKPGDRMTLILEPFDANPQLASRYLSDTLPADWDLAPYFDASDPR